MPAYDREPSNRTQETIYSSYSIYGNNNSSLDLEDLKLKIDPIEEKRQKVLDVREVAKKSGLLGKLENSIFEIFIAEQSYRQSCLFIFSKEDETYYDIKSYDVAYRNWEDWDEFQGNLIEFLTPIVGEGLA